VLPCREAPEEAPLIGDHGGQDPADPVGLPDHVVARDVGRPAVRQDQRSQDLEERGLPRPVRAEEPEELAGPDLEGDSLERWRPLLLERAPCHLAPAPAHGEPFPEPVDPEHRRLCGGGRRLDDRRDGKDAHLPTASVTRPWCHSRTVSTTSSRRSRSRTTWSV